jgi:hypothetical protein
MVMTVLDLIVHRMNKLINEEPDCMAKMRIVESISINVWKTVRVLQTKKNEGLFMAVICRYMQFILNRYHLGIEDPEYYR